MNRAFLLAQEKRPIFYVKRLDKKTKQTKSSRVHANTHYAQCTVDKKTRQRLKHTPSHTHDLPPPISNKQTNKPSVINLPDGMLIIRKQRGTPFNYYQKNSHQHPESAVGRTHNTIDGQEKTILRKKKDKAAFTLGSTRRARRRPSDSTRHDVRHSPALAPPNRRPRAARADQTSFY